MDDGQIQDQGASADRPALQARWHCETCGGDLTMPAGFREFAGYFCCYASMTYCGVEKVPNGDAPNTTPSIEGEA
jgi:hypothetical protein